MQNVLCSVEVVASGIVWAEGQQPLFAPGDRIRVLTLYPVGRYRVPIYLRGKTGVVETVIEPAGIDNEEEAYGRNAVRKRHSCRLALPMAEIWPDHARSPRDGLHIEALTPRDLAQKMAEVEARSAASATECSP